MKMAFSFAAGAACCLATATASYSPTGLNQIPTTDIVPLSSWIGGLQNMNTNFVGLPFYRQPLLSEQTQIGIKSWLEAGLDFAQVPNVSQETEVFNAKALVMTEDDWRPNMAVGVWNVTEGVTPSYYLTLSKTLDYAEEQEERFRAHHRRNRKLLGQRIHLGLTLDPHGIMEPMAGTDLQINESLVFQADWISGGGNAATAGFAYLFWDQRTVLTPAIVFSNDSHRISGLQISITHQFNL